MRIKNFWMLHLVLLVQLFLLLCDVSTEALGYGADGPATPSKYEGGAVASTCIINQTNIRIYFSIKWGDGSSTEYSLDPGKNRYFYWIFNQDQIAANNFNHPMLSIYFDNDVSG